LSGSDQERSHPPAAGAPQVDLTSGIATGALVISAETREDPADRAHRHQQETADAALRRWKDGIRFALSCLLLVAVTGLAASFALDRSATVDEKAWSRTVLAGLVSAVAGYFIGKHSKD
jgi:hypothetical protein